MVKALENEGVEYIFGIPGEENLYFLNALSVLIALVGMMFTGIIIAVTLNTTSVTLEKHVDERVIEKMKEKFG